MQVQKHFFFLLLILLVSCQNNTFTTENIPPKTVVEKSLDKIILDREDLGLIGNVKSSLEYEYDYAKRTDKIIKIKNSTSPHISADKSIDKILDVPIKESYSYLFNSSGKLIKKIRFANHDNIYMEVVENYEFDHQDKLLSWTQSRFNDKIVSQKEFTYDSAGRLIEFKEKHLSDSYDFITKVSYQNDTIQFNDLKIRKNDTTFLSSSKYDLAGKLIFEDSIPIKTFDSIGNLIIEKYVPSSKSSNSFSIYYDYNSDHQKVRHTKYDSQNQLVEIITFNYNEQGKLRQEIRVDSTLTEIKRYDERGNINEYTSIPLNNEEYNFHGNWTNYDQYGNIIKRVFYAKDENGKLVESIEKVEIKYDEIGNWISKKVYQNDSLITLFHQEIKYF